MRLARLVFLILSLWAQAFFAGCNHSQVDSSTGAPPPLKVEHVGDTSVFSVEHSDKFPLAVATERTTSAELRVTATVSPDVSRAVPVVTLATGRVIEIKATR